MFWVKKKKIIESDFRFQIGEKERAIIMKSNVWTHILIYIRSDRFINMFRKINVDEHSELRALGYD